MGIRLLIVEDDREIARLLSTYLSRFDFDVTVEYDGEAGWQRYQKSAFDVVLLDGLLPGRIGIDIARDIREAQGGDRVGIAMMSAAFKSSATRREALHKVGVDAWFDKPFVVADLREKLTALAQAKNPALRHAKSPQRHAPKTGAAPAAPAPSAPGIHAARTRTAAPESRVVIDKPQTVARTLLDACRARKTGLLKAQNGACVFRVALVRGVVVGCVDNLRESRLAERLLRKGRINNEQLQNVQERVDEKGERVAEALLELGYCAATELLSELRAQAHERLVRLIGWREGVLSFEETTAAAPFAIGALDVLSAALDWAFRYPDVNEVVAWVRSHKEAVPLPGADLDRGLLSYQRLAPTSLLPGILLSSRSAVSTVLETVESREPGSRARYAPHLYALWLAGVICFEDEPARRLALPTVLEPEAETALPNAGLMEELQAAWLRVDGRDYYDVLGIPAGADEHTVSEALMRFRSRMGPERFEGQNLGPALAVAKQLWALLGEMESTLLSPDARARYDHTSGQGKTDPVAIHDARAEQSFLRGRTALARGELDAARMYFEMAVAARPTEPDYVAYLGWTVFQSGEAWHARGRSILEAAANVSPTAMRAAFFLGLADEHAGAPSAALVHLREAARRCPDDPDVMAALARVQAKVRP